MMWRCIRKAKLAQEIYFYVRIFISRNRRETRERMSRKITGRVSEGPHQLEVRKSTFIQRFFAYVVYLTESVVIMKVIVCSSAPRKFDMFRFVNSLSYFFVRTESTGTIYLIIVPQTLQFVEVSAVNSTKPRRLKKITG